MTVGKVNTTERLKALRDLLLKHQLNAFIIPSEDAHQSEYIAACDARRAYISGFTGSAGVAVVTTDKAALWTDGRYFLQASKQLDSNWILMKSGLPGVPTKEKWLADALPPQSRVGIDPQLISIESAQLLSEILVKQKHQIVNSANLVDAIWKDQPVRPQNKVNALGLKYCGVAFTAKVKAVQEELVKNDCWAFVVTALDEIAWLFNLRGSDIQYNPVFFAYALVTQSEAILYIDESKLSKETLSYLQNGRAVVKPYSSVFSDIQATHSKNALAQQGHKAWIDFRCNLAIKQTIAKTSEEEEAKIYLARSPIQVAKAIKNATELEGFRQCHKRDAAALIRYFDWLENELVNKKNKTISEAAAADRLEQFRNELSDFVGLSFDTISSTGANGAIIHYKPEHGDCANIDVDKMYLCDSGGQYLDGTTDVTRTLHFGTPTPREKDAFTRVLQGHIQIDRLIFPKGTTGYTIDSVARLPLWRAGLDFRHGVGHGVGSYLNVHEGPHGIGQRIAFNDTKLEPGMTVTNEPGYYEDEAFGIRIENVLLIKKVETPNRFGDTDYLGFEHVTLVPIQTKLIDASLLSADETKWVNAYNQECFDAISVLLDKNESAFKWLKRETQPI